MRRLRLRFDPVGDREMLAIRSDEGWVPRRPAKGQAVPHRSVNDSVRSWMAGLPEVAVAYARVAIANVGVTEVSHPGVTSKEYAAYVRYWGLGEDRFCGALARWISEGTLPREEVFLALDEWGRARTAEILRSRARMDKLNLDHFMRAAVLGGHDARALALYEREDPAPVATLKAQRVRSERGVAALIAHTRVSGADPARLVDTVMRLLKLGIGVWQDSADYQSPLVWLLIRDDVAGVRRAVAEVMDELRTIILQYNEKELAGGR